MSLFRRRKQGTWYVRFTAPNGRRIYESTRTVDKVAAQEYHDRRKAGLWRTQKLGDTPVRLWKDAVVRWLHESKHLASYPDRVRTLAWLDPYLRGVPLPEVTRDMIDRIMAARKAEGVANATVNRTIQVVQSILRRAEREWDWLNKAPVVRFLPEPKRRVRWLTKAEAQRLLSELPEHLAEMARFSLATGLRESNVTGLRWDQVDLDRRVAWIHPDEAKAGKAISVPLNDGALAVLSRQQGNHDTHVFTFKGHPIRKAAGRAWKKALARAGIENFRWHDWRHTWASWHVQAGTPLPVLQELGGWASAEMVRRYAHLSPGHLAHHANSVDLGGAEVVQLRVGVA